MKTLSLLVLAGALAVPSFAQAPAAKPAPPVAPAKEMPAIIPVSAAVITAPFVLKDGAVAQPTQTEVAGGGKAVFTVTIAKAGNYVIYAVVNAPSEDENSFYLNFDATPEDPLMIWDMTVTKGFEERIVSWRGSGDQDTDEFAPKIFKLTAGEHKLIIVGREPSVLKSVSIRPAAN